MKISLFAFIVSLFFFDPAFAQVGIGTTTPNTHAVLELASPNNNQGLMPPRLTTAQRTATGFTSALTASDKGLLVFDSDENKFYYWKGTTWEPVQNGVESAGGSGTVTNIATGTGLTGGPVTTTGTIALANTSVTSGTYGSSTQVGRFVVDPQGRITNATNVAITGATPTGAAGGDLTGSFPNPTIAASKVTSTAILDGTIATADLAATSVTDAKIASGITVSKISPALTNGQVLTTIAGATAWANAPGGTPSGPAGGDLAGTYPNPTIGVGRVTSATVLDGTLVNNDLSTGAAITDNKLSTVSTPGKVLGDAITSGTIAGTTAINTSGNISTSGQVNAGTASYTGVAVNATSSSNNAIVATSNTGHGVYAQASGGSSRAVWGYSPNGIAVEGQSAAGTGVIAFATTGTGLSSTSTSGNGIVSVTGNTNGGYGVFGQASGVQVSEFFNTYGNAVYGKNTFAGTYGILGAQYGVYGNGGGTFSGVYGDAGGTYGVGVTGNSTAGNAGEFYSQSGYGIYATSQTKDAGRFFGSVTVTNGFNVTGGTKNFKIDHPLDPSNKYLYHASIESSEVLNIYSGTIILGKHGKGTVTMPEWFGVLNKDYRYQLTCIGGFAKVYVDEELTNNQFRIGGGKKGMKISWQITGVRNDVYMQKHPFRSEVEKSDGEKGTYLNPAEHGVPEALGVDYEITRRMSAKQ